MPSSEPIQNHPSPDSTPKSSRLLHFWKWTSGMGWFRRWLTRLTVFGIFAMLALWAVFEIYFGSLARGYDMKQLGAMPERSLVFDSAGTVIGKMHGENRVVVTREHVSPFFIQALLAREDDRFYEHGGVDWVGVLRATVRNFKEGRAVQGASTITMQLARNSFGLGEEKTLHRKLLEIALTRRIESTKKKDEILEDYMNRIFFGNGIYGIERAAQAYFGKAAAALTLDESAMLAGIIRGPNRYSPYRSYDKAVIQRDTVLERMVEKERITPQQAAEAKLVTTKIQTAPVFASQETYAMDAVRRDLDTVLDSEEVEDGGLKIYTSIDSKLQESAEAALENRLKGFEKSSGYQHQTRAQFLATKGAKPEYLQGAIVLLENHTGAIRAIVGGRNFGESAYNRALSAKRQVGSTFKPLVYAAAVEKGGLLPWTLVSDDPILAGEIRSAEGQFAPQNSDGTFTGMQPMQYGLAHSRNTMSVRVGEHAGIDNVLAISEQAGVKDIPGRSAQLYIGNLGATLKSMTSAFSIFPNGGKRCRPYVIDHIENAAGETIFRSGKIEYEVVSEGTAYVINGMMQKVMQPGGTGYAIKQFNLKSPLAGKTGTTDDYKDAWFIGSTPSMTCGVWVGLDDPERIVGQGYGGRLAMPVWADVLKQVETATPAVTKETFAKPALTTIHICPQSGMLAGPNCPQPAPVDVPVDLMPNQYCMIHGGAGGYSPAGTYAPKPREEPSVWQRLKGLFR